MMKKMISMGLIVAGMSWGQTSLVEEALAATIKFYGAQRSGTLDSNWILSQYPDDKKGACFTQDGESYQPGLDLTGGWHDAGDNIKFTNTIAWSAYVLLKGYEAFPDSYTDNYNVGYGASDKIPDVLNEVKWATDYLLKVHLDSSTLVTQIGDGEDHEQGLTCVAMSKAGADKGGDPRTVWFGPTKDNPDTVKADILGVTAAALALMGNVYKDIDADYAAKCIKSARQLYETAKDRPGVTDEPNSQGFYKTNSFKDDLMCGGIELYRATNEQSYLDDAILYKSNDHNYVMDWNTHEDPCWHSFAVAGQKDEISAAWKEAMDRYKASISNNEFVKGLAFFGDWGSLRYAMNSAFSAALYASAFNDEEAKKFAESQVAYVLGKNTYDRSFIIGVGKNSPQKPQHKNAYGIDNWFGITSVPKYELTGALVGGPHTNDVQDKYLTSPPGYQDIMTDYICNEITIDYNAGLVGALAYAVETGFDPSTFSGIEKKLMIGAEGIQLISGSGAQFVTNGSWTAEIYQVDGKPIWNSQGINKGKQNLNWKAPAVGKYFFNLKTAEGVYSESFTVTK